MGRKRYEDATKLLITCDSGGSNSKSSRLWKLHLSLLAKDLGLKITVAHLPPGTSKWNKIEHRMFSFISKNWRGRPLYSYQTVVHLISNTTTKNGLKVKAGLDHGTYVTGIKVSNAEMSSIKMRCKSFRGDLNYTISF